MSEEPPPDYVAFIERRLPDLHARVSHEVGGDRQVEEDLLPQVLADVAGRWTMLRLVARHLRNPDLPDRYLNRAVRVHAARWRQEQIYPVQVTFFDPREMFGFARPRLAPVSVALRRAPFLDSTVRGQFAALAEASVAWCHAYETRRHRRRIAYAVLAGLLLLVLVALSGGRPVE